MEPPAPLPMMIAVFKFFAMKLSPSVLAGR
jgi:hypothetical protein